jgi:phosphoserine phosphatase RsbX
METVTHASLSPHPAADRIGGSSNVFSPARDLARAPRFLCAMIANATQRQEAIEWSVASRAIPGQAVSGDLHVVKAWEHGVLIGVVDGLGHGDEATAAARIATAVLEQYAGEDVVPLVQHCHRALQRTRGVVMTVVSLNTRDETATTLGIGNVETVIHRADPQARPQHESVLLRGGVVGYQLPALQASVTPIAAGDVVVFGTDGVREDFSDLINPAEPPARIVDRIMAKKFRGTDDGLVLACKYTGKP